MIRAFRRSRFLVVTAVVALLGAIPMAVLPLAHGGDDPACEPEVVFFNGSAPHISDERTPLDQSQHCMICHWSRWTRATQVDWPAVAPSVSGGPVETVRVTFPRTITTSLSLARAPPLV